jgi:ribonuclease BN (tRNA processing enzyme)
VGLTITVLGCDGSYAGPGGACSGYLLSSGDTHVWLDCGPGTLANLQQHIDPRDLTAIVATHSHPDHWGDLPIAYNAFGYYFGRRSVPLFGTNDIRERLKVAKGGTIDDVYDWHTITHGSEFDTGPLHFRCAVTDHPVETLAMRVEAGAKVFAYTSDTGSAWPLSALGPGIDLLFCEATFPEEQAGEYAHLTASEAGAAARAAGVSRLVLTHLLPGADHDLARTNAGKTFGGNVEIATTHMRIEL